MKETLADRIEAMQRRMVAGTAIARRRAFQASSQKRGGAGGESHAPTSDAEDKPTSAATATGKS